MKFSGDVDVDLGSISREKLLAIIKHTPAAMREVSPIRKHNSGVYVTDIPYDPVHDMATLDYAVAENRGYFKLDLLTVHLYDQVRDPEHLTKLIREPDWTMLLKRNNVIELFHLNNHYSSIQKMPEPINSIPRLAMFMAIIRPAKKHLIGRPWNEVAKTVWDKDADGEYSFKKSHSLAYAHLVVVNMNLLTEQHDVRILQDK